MAQDKAGDTHGHARTSSIHPLTSTAEEHDSAFVAAANEMAGKYFGPISTNEFLDYYLPTNNDMPQIPEFCTTNFAAISGKRSETEMYIVMISALKPFCQDIVLLNTSTHEDPDSGVFLDRCIKPDISFYDKTNAPASGDNPTSAKTMLGFIEFKNSPNDEPFSINDTPFEPDTPTARDTRGQIALYNTSISASQFRTRVFSVFVNQSTCRLMCATRCGTFVTESFNYTQDSSLATLFWRLSHSSAETRGIDTTFHRVTEEDLEIANARQTLQLVNGETLYKVSVVDEESFKTSFYIVSDPFTASHCSPTGRCSRCFQAYDLQRNKVVLLKDNWRIDGFDPEGKTYRVLNSKNVRNIPQLITAGNVSGSPGWTCGNEPFLQQQKRGVHLHYRLVLDTVGYSLTHFTSTWQLVNAIYDAIIAHGDAFTLASQLHRDISVGNIIITDDGRGMLIDWELSKHLEQKEPRSYERTGTWQFKSIRLLEATAEKPVEHSVGDDLESFLWVLSWVVGRNAPSSMTDVHRALFLQMFDQHLEAGYAKKLLLRGGPTNIDELEINTIQVSDLLTDLWLKFAGRYRCQSFLITKRKSEKEAHEWLQQLETHDWMVGELRAALADDGWRNLRDASVPRQVVIMRRTLTKNQKKRKSAMSEYLSESGLMPLQKKLRTEGEVSQD
ncbi:hypothetical protein GYMLUDRAFT_190229 [Collybiopsis luxurians FD-317 M1]|nr:hypothetical protein GYMLUDRAFT_190229 [Collybiopsis luxurians FD-317 M1]